MRRIATAVLLLLLALFGAYSALWFVVAGRMRDEIAQWTARERPRKLDVSWETLRVRGYPFAFRVEANGLRLRDQMPGRAVEVRVPLVEASAHPWNFRSWAIDLPGGMSAIAGAAEAPRARLTARTVTGEVAQQAGGDLAIRLALEHPAFDADGRVTAREAIVSASLPPQPPRTHSDPALGLAVAAYEVQMPQIPAPFRSALDELAFDVTVLGPVPDLPPRPAAEAWRDAGGTIEVEKIAARSGDLAVTGSGTLALDREMQPEAAFSGSVEGYDKLMAGLTEAGILPLGGSVLARVGLALLAKPGPDGQSRIKTSLTIQNGEMSLGPIKLGTAPHIDWE